MPQDVQTHAEQVKQSIGAFAAWLAEDEKSDSTIKSYISTARIFFSRYPELTKANMIAFKQDMLKRYKMKTATIRVIGMNRYCQFAGKPECKVKSVKQQKAYSADNIITKEEYSRLLSSLQSTGQMKNYWMIRFLAGTGCRVSEFVRLTRRCLEDGEITMWTKGKMRRILIPKSLIDESAEYFAAIPAPPEAPLFPSWTTGGVMSRSAVRQMLLSTGTKCGIRKDVLHPHALRHLFALNFLEHSNNISLLSDLMGHASINTTAIYLRMSCDEQKKKLSEIVDW